MILKCTCESKIQDKLHGKGRRVCNKLTGKENSYRCTVCKTEHAAKG